MEKDIFPRAKKYTFELLGYTGRVPLHALCQDSCSEVSRLLGQCGCLMAEVIFLARKKR
jgi:hypothetical protein